MPQSQEPPPAALQSQVKLGDKLLGDTPFLRGSPGKHKGESLKYGRTLTVSTGAKGENRSLLASRRLEGVGEFLKTPFTE